MGERVFPFARPRSQAVWGAFNRVSRATDPVYFEQNRVLNAGAFSPECYSME